MSPRGSHRPHFAEAVETYSRLRSQLWESVAVLNALRSHARALPGPDNVPNYRVQPAPNADGWHALQDAIAETEADLAGVQACISRVQGVIAERNRRPRSGGFF
jgi:hypothetical protein